MEGVTRSGWKLVYTDQPSQFFKDSEGYRKVADFSYSLGLTIDNDGRLVNVVWDSVAFRQGLTVGYTLLAVDGWTYTADRLKAATTAARSSHAPLELLFKKDDRYRVERIDYHDGLRYPVLERIAATPDRLDQIFQPR